MPARKSLARSRYHKTGYRRPNQAQQFWNWWNGPHEFTVFPRWSKVLILFSVVLFSALALSPTGLFHSYQPSNNHSPDPYTYIWQEDLLQCVANGPNTEFNTQNAKCDSAGQSNCPNVANLRCLELQANHNGNGLPSIVLTRNPIEISSASAKELGLVFSYYTNASNTQNFNAMLYLTNNKTLPANNPNYSPTQDSQVIFVIQINCSTGPTSCFVYFYQLRNQGDTISNEYTGECGGHSSCMGIVASNPASHATDESSIMLNYTGSQTAGGGPSTTYTCIGVSPCNPQVSTVTSQFPILSLTPSYYLGFWEDPTYSQQHIEFVNNQALCVIPVSNQGYINCMSISSFVPTPPACSSSNPCPNTLPTVDTGGFFGPVIKALIQIGTFIIQAVFAFGTYLYNLLAPVASAIFSLAAAGLSAIVNIFYNVIKGIIDGIGSIIGIPNLGTQFFNLLADINAWFSSVFGNIIGQIGAFITGLGNALSALGSTLTTYWSDFAAWMLSIKDLLTLFWSEFSLFFTIPTSFIFAFWLLYGALKFSRSLSSGLEWYHLTSQYLFLGFSITVTLVTLLVTQVIIPIGHAVQSFSTTLGARPKVEVAGTSTP